MELLNPLTVYRSDNRYFRSKQDVACLSSDTVGEFMSIRGDRVNGKWRVYKADPGDESKMPSVGLLVTKSTPTVGVIQLVGPVTGIFTGLMPGRTYCLDYNGLKLGPPVTGVSGYSWRQFMGVAVATDVFFLQPSFGITIRRS